MKTSLAVTHSAALAAVLSCVMMTAAGAQERGRRGGGFGRGVGGPGMGGDPALMLLRNEEVQLELQLSPQQKEALEKMAQQSRPERPEGSDFREMDEDQRREFFEKMRAEQEERVTEMKQQLEEVLLPNQTQRLNQIALQVRGVQALSDPEVAKKLNVTEEQTKELEQVRESLRTEMQEKMRSLFSNRDRDSGGDMREELGKMREEMEGKILAVLTPAQQKQFEEMKGEPFELPAGAMGFGRGGDRGGFRGGRGGFRGQRDGDREE